MALTHIRNNALIEYRDPSVHAFQAWRVSLHNSWSTSLSLTMQNPVPARHGRSIKAKMLPLLDSYKDSHASGSKGPSELVLLAQRFDASYPRGSAFDGGSITGNGDSHFTAIDVLMAPKVPRRAAAAARSKMNAALEPSEDEGNYDEAGYGAQNSKAAAAQPAVVAPRDVEPSDSLAQYAQHNLSDGVVDDGEAGMAPSMHNLSQLMPAAGVAAVSAFSVTGANPSQMSDMERHNAAILANRRRIQANAAEKRRAGVFNAAPSPAPSRSSSPGAAIARLQSGNKVSQNDALPPPAQPHGKSGNAHRNDSFNSHA